MRKPKLTRELTLQGAPHTSHSWHVPSRGLLLMHLSLGAALSPRCLVGPVRAQGGAVGHITESRVKAVSLSAVT